MEEVRLAAGPSHWWHGHLAEGAGTEWSSFKNLQREDFYRLCKLGHSTMFQLSLKDAYTWGMYVS